MQPNEIFELDADYLKSSQHLEDELCNAIKTFDIDRKRVLYKIVKAIEIKI